MEKNEFKSLILEVYAEIEQSKIDSFISEFKDFNVKEEKKSLPLMLNRLKELHRHVKSNLFTNESNGLKSFYALKNEIKSLKDKIHRYESNKDVIDALARKHSNYVFRKHGKLI